MPYDRKAMQDILEKAQRSVEKRNGHPTSSAESPPYPQPVEPAQLPATSYADWRYKVGMVVKKTLDDVPPQDRPMIASMERARLVDLIVKQAHEVIDERTKPFWPLPEGLSESEVDEELHALAGQAVKVFCGHYLPADQVREVILTENAEQADVSNAEYLSRAAIIEGLDYERATSVIVGGKHEGKTTCVRTMGLAVAAGEPVFGRPTVQVPVLYAASDDEYATTRMELLRMGWLTRRLPLILVRVRSQDGPEPEEILSGLARLAEKEGSRYVILDMLFDFIRVTDENRYAQTRQAIGHIQNLADEINGHVRCTHHSPKWLPDAASAAKAALGSQGIAARFSPIVLAKKWADDLFTLESTMTRDPRGRALAPIVVSRDQNGWARSGGEFKAWMKWVAYRERIMALFEGDDGARLSVHAVSEALDVSKHEIGNALLQMQKAGMLDRVRAGRSYLYSMPVARLFDDSGA